MSEATQQRENHRQTKADRARNQDKSAGMKVTEHGEKILRQIRDSQAPRARVVATTDLSVPRGLQRAVRTHKRDLLVVGSSRDAAAGTVRLGKRTRQLLCHFQCALAVAPRGIHSQQAIELRTGEALLHDAACPVLAVPRPG
jgi:hypothetical protein